MCSAQPPKQFPITSLGPNDTGITPPDVYARGLPPMTEAGLPTPEELQKRLMAPSTPQF